jgi:hypothetical protein
MNARRKPTEKKSNQKKIQPEKTNLNSNQNNKPT